MPAATSAVVEGAPPERSGVASATLNASRQVGGALGIALLGSFIATAMFPGAQVAMIVAGAGYVIARVLSVAM
jgi:MFS transporter, DHA2 family, methylenomycin A resistance protein